ncbi:unnamed protein product, partial [Mesorhabditis belari]|uniref:Protein FAM136A n=1 Tax=Mesorhabditis belari TaxID=2138241 RepID=A0AAF3EGC3_9BILA
MEETQQKVKRAVDSMMDEIDKKHLREMQKRMFECSAKCCSNQHSSREVIENCVDTCNGGMRKAQGQLEMELGTLQAQLSRCAMSCYDDLTKQFGPDTSKYTERQTQEFNERLDRCVAKCADEHVSLLPKIQERFAKFIRSL